MSKPLVVEVGQRWFNSESNYKIRITELHRRAGETLSYLDGGVERLDGNRYIGAIYQTNNSDRHIGYEVVQDDNDFLNGPLWKFIETKRINIVCRSCGNKSEWIVGTSKRSYVCPLCRIL
jgi:hypothetical protein